jgi:hypothetical protein
LTQSFIGGRGASALECSDGSVPEAIQNDQRRLEAAQAADPDTPPDELDVERRIGVYVISDSEAQTQEDR